MFASSRDYRDSIDVVDNGLLKKAYVLYLDIADEAGGIATIATILAMEKISIKNIGIIHNREFEEVSSKLNSTTESLWKRVPHSLRKEIILSTSVRACLNKSHFDIHFKNILSKADCYK